MPVALALKKDVPSHFEWLLLHADVEKLVSNMNALGYGSIDNAFSSEALARMRAYCQSAIETSHGHYTSFVGADSVVGSGLEDIGASPVFHKIVQRIFELGAGAPAPPVSFHFVLRCLTGPEAAKHSLNFHYDSFVITVLIPIEIPTADDLKGGAFVMLPNTRPIRRHYLANLLEKMLLDNRLTRSLLAAAYKAKPGWFLRIKPVPGSIYFFWGYRSLHTNESCDIKALRATALFHYGDPHAESPLKQILRG